MISCWVSDLVASYSAQCISIVDCFSGQWTERCMHTSWANSQLQVPVAPDCTPLLQVTDTCQSFVAKRAGESRKAELELLLREKARREGVQYQAKAGAYELFEVGFAMAVEGDRRQSQRYVVLAQCIKSQLLVMRPTVDGQVLQSIEQEEWSNKFPRLPSQMRLQEN